MKTFIVLSRKGGTAKTSTAHALGSWLMKQGKRVLFIDMDGQANLTLVMGADEDAPNAYDLLCQGAQIGDTIQHTEHGDIIAGNELLHVSEKYLEGAEDTRILSKALESVKKQYDYCVIDTPAALGMVTLNCIVAANKIIVPVQAELFSAQGIGRIASTLETVKEQCGVSRKIDGLLITRLDMRTNISKSMSNDLVEIAKANNTKVYKAVIRECSAIKEAALMQQSIFDYAPRSRGASDYRDFITEFLG